MHGATRITFVLLLKCGGIKREKGVIYLFRGLRKCLECYLTRFQQGCAHDVDNFVPVVLEVRR